MNKTYKKRCEMSLRATETIGSPGKKQRQETRRRMMANDLSSNRSNHNLVAAERVRQTVEGLLRQGIISKHQANPTLIEIGQAKGVGPDRSESGHVFGEGGQNPGHDKGNDSTDTVPEKSQSII